MASIGSYNPANTIDATNDYLLIQTSGVYKKINRNILLGITGTPLGNSDSQTLTNKTIDNTNAITQKGTQFTLQDDSDTTKQARFLMSSISAGTIRSYTLPDASATLVGTSATQALTNKTLTSPTITGGTIDNSTITVDSISGHSVATTVTVANLQIANGVLNSANAVTATSIAIGAVQPQALVTGTGSGWAYQSWTPTFSNWTIGTGGSASTVAKYIQIGKAVFFRIKSVLGSSGQSVGAAPTFSLPVTSNSDLTLPHPICIVRYSAAGTGYLGYIYFSDTTHGQLIGINSAGTYTTDAAISSTVPNTWAAGDYFVAQGFYEAA